jgi:hypothetical protein
MNPCDLLLERLDAYFRDEIWADDAETILADITNKIAELELEKAKREVA